MLFVVEYHGGQQHPADAAFDGQLARRLPRILHEHVGGQRTPVREVALAQLGIVAEEPQRRIGDATPVPPARPSRNSKRPFWLFVPPGMALTLIWSKSSSPEYSTWTPPLNVWRPLTQVVVFETVWIGPDEEAGYGPPSIVRNRRCRSIPSESCRDFLLLEHVRVVDPVRCCAGRAPPSVKTLMNTSSFEYV